MTVSAASASTGAASANQTSINAEMAGAVGAVLARRVSFPITASDIRRWALAVYYPSPPPERYLRSADGSPLVAPEEFNPFAWICDVEEVAGDPSVSANDPDRTEKALGITPPGLKFQLNGGLAVEYGRPMRVGDVITGISTLSGYSERVGRLGAMLITEFADAWTNQDGELVKTQRLSLIRY